MKIIVVYSSKTGFTKKYAEWIAEELSCNILPYKDFSKEVMEENDVMVFGSRIHAGKIDNLNKVKAYFYDNSKQKIIVFATGATPSAAQNVINKMWDNNFTEAEIKTIPHFYMQSGLNYEEMRLTDRTIMKIAAKLMSKKKVKNEEDKGFEQAIRASYDISSKECIVPLVNYIKDNYKNC